ncbi:hypothetical protein ABZ622_28715 [Streptomyces sp. NPDC007164]|uniref:hypothetical protein n=1 Tax=Streptomyces sp. NPDC007164 TaxID=3156918 RepID=UPI0033C87741
MAGVPVPSAAGTMTEARGGTSWTRSIRDGVQSGASGGSAATTSSRTTSRPTAHSPTADGDVVVQDEDLGRWVNAQQFGWERLLPVQQLSGL